jgi:hypothetical protein
MTHNATSSKIHCRFRVRQDRDLDSDAVVIVDPLLDCSNIPIITR